ncbi:MULTISPECIES: hypothetical protein [unclassified Streptomyces]|uniref:hypothetical protein n=1 Tax=unclassified Streptomyces TaxID=2593676 RepID=UPI0033ADAAC1
MRAIEAAARARTEAERALERPHAERARARRALTASLVELREAADIAAGEWWQRALPEQELLAAERAGHRTLAATAQRLGPPARAPRTRRGEVARAPSIGAA